EDGEERDVERIRKQIGACLDRPGCALIDIIQANDDDYTSVGTSEDGFRDTDDGLDLDILASLGLLRRVSERSYLPGATEYDVLVIYYHVTEIGVDFLKSCDPDIFSDAKAVNPVRPGMIEGYP